MRLLLVSNSGSPFLAHCREEIARFVGPGRCVGYITAARLGDQDAQFDRARRSLAEVGVVVEHLRFDGELTGRITGSEAVFTGGGNTYALLSRLRASGALDALARRVREGMPYVGTSAGSNIAGPNILATNDWNVVAATQFDGMHLVPWVINPHYKETDPAMAPGSETRDQRIAEFLGMNDLPVLALEEETAIRVEQGTATVVGRGRARVFRRGVEPLWLSPGERVPGGREVKIGA